MDLEPRVLNPPKVPANATAAYNGGAKAAIWVVLAVIVVTFAFGLWALIG